MTPSYLPISKTRTDVIDFMEQLLARAVCDCKQHIALRAIFHLRKMRDAKQYWSAFD